MTIKKLVPILFLACVMNVSGQLTKSFKETFLEADYNFMMQDYQKALDLFENILEIDPGNTNLNFLCGATCLKLGGNNPNAILYLEIAVRGVDPSYKGGSYKERYAPTEAYLLLARAYRYSNKFHRAIVNYQQYRKRTDIKKISEIEFVNRQIESCELAMSMITTPLKVRFQNIIEDPSQIYSRNNPVISGNDSILVYRVNNPFNPAIMMMTWQNNKWAEPRRLNNELGATGHFSPVCISYDGSELYLVQEDHLNSDIFVSQLQNGRWTKAEPLNKRINTRYHETHASVSRDGNMLFFTSDRKGGYGGLDIYRSERKANNSWGEPINLGPSINTVHNEETPFITNSDSKLCFSSDGHQTMGGYDIFTSVRNQDETWSSPVNVGYPVCTSSDDLFYNPGWNDQCGYYSWKIEGQPIKNIKYIWILPDEKSDVGMSISHK